MEAERGGLKERQSHVCEIEKEEWICESMTERDARTQRREK